jgi:hypothetical protein
MKSRLQNSSFAFIAFSVFCSILYGQPPREPENRTSQPGDLIAYVESEDGKPISGVDAKLEITRTVGFFSGAGTPPIASRRPSSNKGELRFSNGSNYRDWIQAEVASRKSNNRKTRDGAEDITQFKAYRWTVSGYWPRTNSRIEFRASGRPELWDGGKAVRLILPALHPTRVRVASTTDGSPLANVRLWITQQHGHRLGDQRWDTVGGFAWTDTTGTALIWLPNGSYDVRWDTTLSIAGIDAKSDLFDIRTTEFGEPGRLSPPRNALADQSRVTAFQSNGFWWKDTQAALIVEDASPDIYQIEVEPPLLIVP